MNPLRHIYLVLVISNLIGEQPDTLNPIVFIQMLLLKSKLSSNPILWQDTREGYLRNRAVRVCDIALDNIGTVPGAQLIDTYYPRLDSLLNKFRDGKEFVVLQGIQQSQIVKKLEVLGNLKKVEIGLTLSIKWKLKLN